MSSLLWGHEFLGRKEDSIGWGYLQIWALQLQLFAGSQVDWEFCRGALEAIPWHTEGTGFCKGRGRMSVTTDSTDSSGTCLALQCWIEAEWRGIVQYLLSLRKGQMYAWEDILGQGNICERISCEASVVSVPALEGTGISILKGGYLSISAVAVIKDTQEQPKGGKIYLPYRCKLQPSILKRSDS